MVAGNWRDCFGKGKLLFEGFLGCGRRMSSARWWHATEMWLLYVLVWGVGGGGVASRSAGQNFGNRQSFNSRNFLFQPPNDWGHLRNLVYIQRWIYIQLVYIHRWIHSTLNEFRKDPVEGFLLLTSSFPRLLPTVELLMKTFSLSVFFFVADLFMIRGLHASVSWWYILTFKGTQRTERRLGTYHVERYLWNLRGAWYWGGEKGDREGDESCHLVRRFIRQLPAFGSSLWCYDC